MSEELKKENYFSTLYDVDVRDKTKTKNGLSYLSWATAWAEVKRRFPDATYKIYEQLITIEDQVEGHTVTREVARPWFDDGSTGWVKTGVIINGIEHIEDLPIMDFKNKSIEASKITSADANKSIQRSLTKACARHGIGLYIYQGEDLPLELKEVEKLQGECMELIGKRSALSENTKKKVAEVCKEALPEENGDPRLCNDSDVLEALKKKLMAIRKIA